MWDFSQISYNTRFFLRYFLVCCLLFLNSFWIKAQVQENFSKFDIQKDTLWWGDKDSFQISSSTSIPAELRPALRLNGANGGKSYLGTTLNLENYDTIVWNFWAKLSFAPTTSNYARFYLLSETKNLKEPPVGIYVSLGENQKSVTLFRQTSSKLDTLIKAYPLSKTTNVTRIQVKYSVENGWELSADSLGGRNFVKFGSSQEICPKYLYTGIYCNYTKTNAGNIYFDDIEIKNLIKDTLKPFVEKVEVEYPNHVKVYFSEEIDLYSVFNEMNYWVDKRIEEPLYVEYTSKVATLVFAEFRSMGSYNLTVKGLKDLSGNEMDEQTISFFYTVPECLLINEILFNPKQGCPVFVEVYNNSETDISLANLSISTYDKTKDLLKTVVPLPSQYILKAKDYMVLTPNAMALDSCYTGLEPKKVVELATFPTFAKTEGIIVLARNDSVILDRFDYSDKMHFHFLKDKQGVSLERKFVNKPTQDADNWTSATEEAGGATPTYKNSQFEGGNKHTITVGDIIINEILFNPKDGGSTFVEIYNKSDKEIPLKYFCVSTFDKTKETLKTLSSIQENHILPANDYLVLTKNKDAILNLYSVPSPEKILQMETFPSFTKTEGTVILALPDSTIIDRLDYSDKMHFALLKDKQGVSLERKFFDFSTQDANNWTSAMESAGWATPTYKNSQSDSKGNSINIGDIIINEILFNPKDGGSTFVEIYNKSDKDIPLKYFCVATFDKTKGTLKTLSPIQENYIFPANDYLVLTKDKEAILNSYLVPLPEKIIQMEAFPSFTKTEGTVILALSDSTIIDRLDYFEKMHFALLKEKQGVSLERRYFNKLTQDASNWQSAAQSIGWATPTGKNSQYQEQPYIEDIIKVNPELFTPNNDGHNDQVNFHYKLEKSGLLVNASIYNAKGLKVKVLQQNMLAGTEGSFSWNGLDEQEKKCAIGFYILWIEFVDTESGKTHNFKKTFVLGG